VTPPAAGNPPAGSPARIGLIINDGKSLALDTAAAIEARLRQAGLQTVRASSACVKPEKTAMEMFLLHLEQKPKRSSAKVKRLS
jgi:hypothetical protein